MILNYVYGINIDQIIDFIRYFNDAILPIFPFLYDDDGKNTLIGIITIIATISIPLSLFAIESSKDGDDPFGSQIVYRQILQIKNQLLYYGIMFIPVLFWNSDKEIFKDSLIEPTQPIIRFGLILIFIIGLCLQWIRFRNEEKWLTSIEVKEIKNNENELVNDLYINSNRFEHRLKYLKSKESSDYFTYLWSQKDINFQIERQYFRAYVEILGSLQNISPDTLLPYIRSYSHGENLKLRKTIYHDNVVFKSYLKIILSQYFIYGRKLFRESEAVSYIYDYLFETIEFIIQNSWKSIASRAIFCTIESIILNDLDNFSDSSQILTMYSNDYVNNHWSRGPVYDYFKRNDYLIRQTEKGEVGTKVIFRIHYLWGALNIYLFSLDGLDGTIGKGKIDTMLEDLIPGVDPFTFARLFYLNQRFENVLNSINVSETEYVYFINMKYDFGIMDSNDPSAKEKTYNIGSELFFTLYKIENVESLLRFFSNKIQNISDKTTLEYTALSLYIEDLEEIKNLCVVHANTGSD